MANEPDRLPSPTGPEWLDLSAAAARLGVHFTTLRRWADAGKVPCQRTPGGRRRFRRADLERFLRADPAPDAPARLPAPPDALVHQQVQRHALAKERWMERLGEVERMRFKYSGQLMLGLLMQYNSRPQGGEAFLQEAERVAGDYGLFCHQAGLSIADTTRAFLFFRHSIMETIFSTSVLESLRDEEGKRLFERSSRFFDQLLIAVLDRYCQVAQNQPPSSP